MSYILDALKRAEAERERGQVPGLNAQPVPVAAAPSGGPRRGLWLAAAAGAAVLAVGALYWPRAQPQAAAPVPPPLKAAPAAMPAVAPAAAPVPAPAAPAAPALPAPVALPAPAPSPTAVPVPVPSVRQAPPVAAPMTVPAPAAQPAPAPATVARPTPAPRPAASATAAPVPALAELPEDLRREVPKLVVSGSVYSQNPAQRMLIVNGQVVNEGASLGPELVLESIGPKSAVLRLRGVPFRLSY
ncbi:MAG: general secretion pathway protein GspB [Ramlibacter sp.]